MTESSVLSQEVQGVNELDTVEQAIRERERQGAWETEVSFGGEADLHRHYGACVKNPGHAQFIPIYKLTEDHLPWEYRDTDAMDYIQVMADLTVRVSVKLVSENRPEKFPDSDRPFPFYNLRGKQVLRTGTGVVFRMDKYPEDTCKCTECCSNLTSKICECTECLSSSAPKTQFAEISIRTAAHVVCDQLEGAQTTCHIFFDKGGVPDIKNGVMSLTGTVRANSSIGEDVIDLIFSTHDRSLIDKLDRLFKRLHNIYNMGLIFQRPKDIKCRKISVVISHPHGCSKQISFGEFLEGINPGPYRLKYTSPTCPGSSGAPNLTLTERTCSDTYYAHSGHCLNDRQYNYSSAWSSYLLLVRKATHPRHTV